jgi:signal peptidase I
MNKIEPSKTKKILYFLTALILSGIGIRVFVLDSFTVTGNSMAPTIQEGDHVFVNKLAYWSKRPARGDIVVGNFRDLAGTKVIKRVIALPDEWLWLENGVIQVSKERNGPSEEAGHVSEAREKMGEQEPFYYRLDPYEYFLSGDNEVASVDSFELGPVDSYHIDGRVIGSFRLLELRYIPF